MKKNILTLYLLLVASVFVLFFFHGKSMVDTYNRGLILSLDKKLPCEEILSDYEAGNGFANENGFENWSFCVSAQGGAKLFFYEKVLSLPIASIFIFLAFYQRRFQIKMRNRAFVAVLLSPLAILFFFSFVFNLFLLTKNYLKGDPLFDHPDQIYSLATALIFLAFVALIFVVRFIFRKLSSKWFKKE
jgi:hypothetical protein